MRNLLERLKPEHQAKLHGIKFTYPMTYSDLCDKLSKTSFYTELKVGVANELCSHLEVTFTLSNFIDLFNEK